MPKEHNPLEDWRNMDQKDLQKAGQKGAKKREQNDEKTAAEIARIGQKENGPTVRDPLSKLDEPDNWGDASNQDIVTRNVIDEWNDEIPEEPK